MDLNGGVEQVLATVSNARTFIMSLSVSCERRYALRHMREPGWSAASKPGLPSDAVPAVYVADHTRDFRPE